MARGIYERLETMERNICSHLGVSPPNVHHTRKRKAVDDNHGLFDSPKTVGIQKQRPPRKSRRTKSTVTKPATKIHSYPLRSADGLQETRADYDCAHDRTPPFDEHVNYQEPRTPYAVPYESNSENSVTTVTVYNPLIFVRPRSYVSPTKSGIDQPPCISDWTPTKRFHDKKPVTVTWEKSNPHVYNSGKIVPASETPPSAAYPSAVIEGAARDLVAVQNKSSPVEEEEKYESCKENISIDSQLQEKHPGAVETLPGSDTDEDDNSVESGGKRLRKKSQKIHGVYTPDARQFKIKTSRILTNSFFLDIATPGKWLSDEHMHVIMKMLWRRRGSVLQKDRMCTKSVKECDFTRGIGLKASITKKRGGDCAPCAAKFMEMHSNGDEKEEMCWIIDKIVDKFREQYAMDCYEEFIGDYRVANEANLYDNLATAWIATRNSIVRVGNELQHVHIPLCPFIVAVAWIHVKQWKRDYDRREMVLFANHCIPKTCVCGGPITLATDDKGMSYYECKEYEDDGLHIRHRCFEAIKEELEELKKKVSEEASSRMNVEDEMRKIREDIKLLKELCIEDDGLYSRHRCFDAIEEELVELKKEVSEESNSRMKMEDELKEMREDIRLLKELCKMNQGDYSVREYNTKFLAGGLLDIHDEGTLVKMYREGLREDIRSEIGTTVFSTLNEIMQEALDVDEDDSVYAHSVKRPKKKARTENHRNDDIEDEDHDGDQQYETDAEYESELSLPNPVEGSDDECDSKVDLEDYKEYIEEHHKSDSESSEDSK
ncbi:hypothetical protein DY000_02021100 [Brassica cretica]|uniref:Ubiquitin-like protease family profile domain-containing protein n=1 Tax=Brassica cretica TaxID=69181 RepID=A0ABQ7EAF4_BRACR|nr:hypothetical protein DY000_02021100 [Brassica cretica]